MFVLSSDPFCSLPVTGAPLSVAGVPLLVPPALLHAFVLSPLVKERFVIWGAAVGHHLHSRARKSAQSLMLGGEVAAEFDHGPGQPALDGLGMPSH